MYFQGNKSLVYLVGGLTMRHILLSVVAGLIVPGFLMATPVMAEWSDHHSRRSSAQNSASTTLKYGGTYGQAGQNYINNRDNWKVPNRAGSGNRRSQMTPEQRAEYNRVMQRTNRMIHNIYNKPHHFGPQPRQMSPSQKAEYNRRMQQSDDLIKRIENDPLLK
jgi:Txe/YoeB family toxin of Txe-Axe toxin-antitoxin module